MALYVLDENNNKIEVTTEVLSAVVRQVICCVSGTPHSIAFATQTKYNELQAAGALVRNCIYFITDDTTANDLDEKLEELTKTIDNIIQGRQDVYSAINAVSATYSTNADNAKVATKLTTSTIDVTNTSVGKVARVSKKGLYSCVCKPKGVNNENSKATLLISIEDFEACYGTGVYDQEENLHLYLYSMGGTTSTEIQVHPLTANYDIVSCRLLTEY